MQPVQQGLNCSCASCKQLAGMVLLARHAKDAWPCRRLLACEGHASQCNPLNRVLEEFREWKQPTLMLVGNHDQVWLASYACLAAMKCMHACIAL